MYTLETLLANSNIKNLITAYSFVKTFVVIITDLKIGGGGVNKTEIFYVSNN